MLNLLKFLSLVIIFLILGWNNIFCQEFDIKYGKIKNDEIWKDKVYIIGDVEIPLGITVVVEGGTKIIYADYDLMQSGADPNKCEIIVKGKLEYKGSKQNPILVDSIKKTSSNKIAIDEKTQVIEFRPYKIDTEGMRAEFRGFKQQYLIMWSVIYALWIMR